MTAAPEEYAGLKNTTASAGESSIYLYTVKVTYPQRNEYSPYPAPTMNSAFQVTSFFQPVDHNVSGMAQADVMTSLHRTSLRQVL